jgi:hypothetical protein
MGLQGLFFSEAQTRFVINPDWPISINAAALARWKKLAGSHVLLRLLVMLLTSHLDSFVSRACDGIVQLHVLHHLREGGTTYVVLTYKVILPTQW